MSAFINLRAPNLPRDLNLPPSTQSLRAPTPQNAVSDPVLWNARWETICAHEHASSPQNCLLNSLLVGKFRPTDSIYDSYSGLLTSVLLLRLRIGRWGQDALFEEDFESKWTNASVDDRKKHVLVGLSRPCAAASNLNIARAYCADVLNVEYLSRDPKVLVGLLTGIIPDDTSVIPTTPYYIPNKAWDDLKAETEREGANEIEKVVFAEMFVLRTKLIYFVVEFTFRSFLGMTLPEIIVEKNKYPDSAEMTALIQSRNKAYEQTHGKQAARKLAKERKATRKEHSTGGGRRAACANVGCNRMEAEDEKYKACTKCRESGQRTTLYCSKECQTADWKVRHKVMCGKALDFETAAKVAVNSILPVTSQIGPPVPPFKRTRALNDHIRALNNAPNADIFLRIKAGAVGHGEGFMYFDFDNCTPVQDLIRSHREIAMTTGDKTAVAKLCQFMVWFFLARNADKQLGWDFEAMIQQLEKEFAFPELKDAMLEMQRLQFIDSFLRPQVTSD